MIQKLFTETLEVSLTAAVVILLFTLGSAAIGRRYAARWKCYIWLVIALRMLVPVNPDLSFGRLDFAVPEAFVGQNRFGWLNADKGGEHSQEEQSAPWGGISEKTEARLVRPVGADGKADAAMQPAPEAEKPRRGKRLSDVLAMIWLGGTCALFGWQLVSYLLFCRSVRKNAKEAEDVSILAAVDELMVSSRRRSPRIFLVENAISPMVAGFVRPCLLLPCAKYTQEELNFILRHELTHYRRHDTCCKLLLVAACSVHWFNPLAWLMLRQAGADLELSCDEAVVANEPYAVRKAYSETLLAALGRQGGRNAMLTTQWNGGIKMMKKRLKHIIVPSGNKNGLALLALTLVLMLASGTCMACGARALAADNSTGSDAQERNPQEDTEQSGAEYVSFRTYQENADGTYSCEGKTFRYLLKISGKTEEKPSTFVVLSNDEDVSFEDARYYFSSSEFTSSDTARFAVVGWYRETEPQDAGQTLSFAEMAGSWGLDFERVDASLFGSGIRYGAQLKIAQNGELEYYIGIGVGGTGQCVLNADGTVTAEIKQYEENTAEKEVLTLEYQNEGGADCIKMQRFEETIYWVRMEENAEIPAETNFSEEEEKIMQTALAYFYAWVRGEQDEIKSYIADLADPYVYDVGTAEGLDIDKITDVGVKKGLDFNAEGDTVVLSVEFRATPEDDFFQYMAMELVRRGDDWKVYGAGLQM